MACRPLVIASLAFLFFSSGFCFPFRAETFFRMGYPPYIRDLRLPAKCPYQARNGFEEILYLRGDQMAVSCAGSSLTNRHLDIKGCIAHFLSLVCRSNRLLSVGNTLTRRSTNGEDNLECRVRHSDGIRPERYQQRRRSTA